MLRWITFQGYTGPWWMKYVLPILRVCEDPYFLYRPNKTANAWNVSTDYSPSPQKHNSMVVVALSSLARILGECSTFHSLPALTFFKVEISSRTLIPLFMPGSVNSGSANWDDCGQVFPDELCVSSFLDRFHTMPGQQHSQSTLTLYMHHLVHMLNNNTNYKLDQIRTYQNTQLWISATVWRCCALEIWS